MKKAISILLSVMMIISFCSPVYAEDTVNNESDYENEFLYGEAFREIPVGATYSKVEEFFQESGISLPNDVTGEGFCKIVLDDVDVAGIKMTVELEFLSLLDVRRATDKNYDNMIIELKKSMAALAGKEYVDGYAPIEEWILSCIRYSTEHVDGGYFTWYDIEDALEKKYDSLYGKWDGNGLKWGKQIMNHVESVDKTWRFGDYRITLTGHVGGSGLSECGLSVEYYLPGWRDAEIDLMAAQAWAKILG